MLLKDTYLDRVVGEVEDLASRVALLRGRFAKQKVSVKLEHYWELDFVRTRFAEFKRHIAALEDAEPGELDRLQDEAEVAWKEVMKAVDVLLKALP